MLNDKPGVLIPQTDYDPLKHIKPMAFKPIRRGQLVSVAIGHATFTAEPADLSLGYWDGLALTDAAPGDEVTVAVQGELQHPDDGDTLRPMLIMVLLR